MTICRNLIEYNKDESSFYEKPKVSTIFLNTIVANKFSFPQPVKCSQSIKLCYEIEHL